MPNLASIKRNLFLTLGIQGKFVRSQVDLFYFNGCQNVFQILNSYFLFKIAKIIHDFGPQAKGVEGFLRCVIPISRTTPAIPSNKWLLSDNKTMKHNIALPTIQCCKNTFCFQTGLVRCKNCLPWLKFVDPENCMFIDHTSVSEVKCSINKLKVLSSFNGWCWCISLYILSHTLELDQRLLEELGK